MKASKVREMDGVELGNQAREAEEQLFRLKMQLKMGQSEGLKKYRVLRKNRARMLTVLAEREAAGKK